MNDKEDTIQMFSPGNNLWVRIPRIMMFSFERLIVLGVVFLFTYFCTMSLFSFDWPLSKILFVVVMVIVGVFLILPAPSNPLRLMWSEILIRPFIGIRQDAINGSTIVEPLESEES